MASSPFTLTPTTASPPTHSTILITGGASGIGLATALYLHSPSYHNNIVILDRSPTLPSNPGIETLTISPRLLYLPCDITDWPSQRSAFAIAASHFGHLDKVFINAGIAEIGEQIFTDHLDVDGELAEPDRRTIDIDIRAVGDSLKLAIHHLRSDRKKNTPHHHSSSSSSSIVMTASLAGYLASAGAPLYAKAMYTRVMRLLDCLMVVTPETVFTCAPSSCAHRIV